MDQPLDSSEKRTSEQEKINENLLNVVSMISLLGSSIFIIFISCYIGIRCGLLLPGYAEASALNTQVSLTEEIPHTFEILMDTVPSDSVSTQDDMAQSYGKPSEIQIIKGIVSRGDTASTLLNEHLSLKRIYELSKLCKKVHPLTRIRAGHPYQVSVQDGEFYGFDYEINKDRKLVVRKDAGSFLITEESVVYDIKTEVVTADIAYSLFDAVRKTGESSELAVKISDIFAWDIDFIRDIRPGDGFRALVEKRFRNGKHVGYENILAVFFSNQGQAHKAFIYKDTNGRPAYYDENGKSLRKAFLKAPLDFKRISSGYSRRRFHPILKRYRPHRGIDYAAPKGTPIKTVGDGVVIKTAYTKSAGRYVKIRHTNGYETVYNHMTKYAKGVKRGRQVYQGDVIGFVGSTGYATGPHLDFRMKKHGRYINPLKVKSPSVKPVDSEEMERFLVCTQDLTLQLMHSGKHEEVVVAKLYLPNE